MRTGSTVVGDGGRGDGVCVWNVTRGGRPPYRKPLGTWRRCVCPTVLKGSPSVKLLVKGSALRAGAVTGTQCPDAESWACACSRDAVILPPSALDGLARREVQLPMLFQIENPAIGKRSHCGVLEFIAEEGLCFLPHWVRTRRTVRVHAERSACSGVRCRALTLHTDGLHSFAECR